MFLTFTLQLLALISFPKEVISAPLLFIFLFFELQLILMEVLVTFQQQVLVKLLSLLKLEILKAQVFQFAEFLLALVFLQLQLLRLVLEPFSGFQILLFT